MSWYLFWLEDFQTFDKVQSTLVVMDIHIYHTIRPFKITLGEKVTERAQKFGSFRARQGVDR